mgnify:CR=1 FL=1
MAQAPSRPRGSASARLLVLACTLAVVVAGFLIPFGGLLLGLVFSFTVLRNHRTARWAVPLVGLALGLAWLGLWAPWSSDGTGPSLPGQ